MPELVLGYIFIGAVLGGVGAKAISVVATKIGLIDYPGSRSSHFHPVPKAGGIGIPLSVFFVCIVERVSSVFCLLVFLIAVLGFLSDRYEILPRRRFTVQLIVAVLFVYYKNVFNSRSFWVSIFFVLFIVATTNFFNFMDGVNGLAAMTGIIAFGLLALFSFIMVKNHQVFLISLVLMAACAGFLPFNFPRAKVFMGDVGSVFLGFVFASFVVKLSINISVFLCLVMFLCTFYADAMVTIFYRWRKGENLIQAHRSHLYQYMSNELGWAHWKVSILYATIQFIFGFLALLLYRVGLVWQFVVFGAFGIMFVVIYKGIKNINPRLE